MFKRNMRIKNITSLFLLFVIFCQIGFAEDNIVVNNVTIQGTKRIDLQAALTNITARSGVVSNATIRQDIRNLYKTGFFEQIEARVESSSLIYQVTEKPVIRKVFIKGNEEVSESDLSEYLNFSERRFIDQNAIDIVIRKAINYYKTQGFYDVSFTHSTVAAAENEIDVIFEVKEGKKYKIEEVELRGVSNLDADEMREQIQTQRYKWWSSWLFGTGRVNPDLLQNDKAILKQYLVDHGHVDGFVKDPIIEKRDGELYVTFEVFEGEQYKIGDVTVAGDLIENSEKATLDAIKTQSGEVFSGSMLREDSLKISDKFGDKGYAFANVVPNTSIRRADRLVDVTFTNDKGTQVKIDRIKIKGNTKTYDNVIRRELRVQEQELYSTSKLKRSREVLERLGYFEEVSFSTEPGSKPDEVNMLINVREGSTGTFSVGAGYATSDGPIFNSQLSENNFMGTGRNLTLNADIGTQRENLILSLQDRRLNDSFWSGGVSVMRTDRVFFDFDREMSGGSLNLGYPLEEVFGEWAQDINFSLKYEYMNIDIYNVDPNDAAQFVIDSEGKTTSSSITPSLTRNTINNPLNPIRGSRQVISTEFAGFGGKEDFYLFEASNTIYRPLAETSWGDFIFSMRNQLGYGDTNDGDPFPLFRRYFPGGINSVRGYRVRTLGPKDENGNEYGGSKQFINNFEVIMPLINSAGLKLVVFYDVGEAFDDNQSIDFGELREAYGYGLRWMSPMGPIRLEFGIPIDKQPGEDSMVTLFSFGAPL
jgi:outer membrane protein insertion porin family